VKIVQKGFSENLLSTLLDASCNFVWKQKCGQALECKVL